MPKNAKRTAKQGRKAAKFTGRGKTGARKGKTDWAALDAMTDEDIERQAAEDPDNPIWTDEMFAAARWVTPGAKRTQIALKVDPDVLAFFKKPGPGYQTRMNDVLRAYMEKATQRG